MHFGSTTTPPYKKLLKTTQNKYEGKSQPYSSVTVLSTGSFTISTGCTSTAFASSAVGAGGGGHPKFAKNFGGSGSTE